MPRGPHIDRFFGREAELDALASLVARDRLVTVVGPAGVGKTRLVDELVARHPSRLVVCDAANPDALRRLLAARDGTVLATSRVPLGIAGEVRVELGPLPLDDALALFIERARAMATTRLDLTTARALVVALDGLPLALEAAAAQLVVMTPEQLLGRLERVDRVMAKALAPQLAGLTVLEREALAGLATFVEGFSLEAAEAVLGGGVVDQVATLRDLGWVLRNGDRLRLLACVRRIVASGPAYDAACERHRAWFVREAPRRDASWLQRERGNVEGAIRRSAASEDALAALLTLGVVLREHGPFAEALALIDLVLAHAATVPAHAYELRAFVALQHGDLAATHRDLDRAEATDHRAVALKVQLTRGFAYRRAGDVTRALAAYRQAEALLDPVDLALAAEVQSRLVVAHQACGDHGAARRAGEAGLACFRRLGDDAGQAKTHLNLGCLAWLEDHVDLARAHFVSALDAACSAGSASLECMAAFNLGEALLDLGAIDEACVHYERSLALARRLEYAVYDASSLASLGIVHHLRGDLTAAAQAYRGTLAHLRERPDALIEGALHAALVLVAHEAKTGDVAFHLAHAARHLDAIADAPYRAWLEVVRQALAASTPLSDRIAHFATAATTREARRHLAFLHAVFARIDRMFCGHQLEVVASAFRIGDAAWVDLARRPTLRRIFERLVDNRVTQVDRRFTLDALFAIGWPGERIDPTASANRVYVAIATLRKLGLGDLLEHGPSGYRLSPSLTVKSVASATLRPL